MRGRHNRLGACCRIGTDIYLELDYMRRLTYFLLFLHFGCKEHLEENAVLKPPTRFVDDVKKMILEQVSNSPDSLYFLAVYFDESRSISGNKVVKLYGKDSLSIDERFYGAHPLEVVGWKDSAVVFKAEVFSAHGDSASRKRYLDAFLDRNQNIGHFAIRYEKNYNSWPSDSISHTPEEGE